MIWNKKPDITLTWKWPDGRESDYMIDITVESVKPQSKGILGIKKTPSVIGWMPDGVELIGVITSDNVELKGKTVTIVLPEDEVKSAGKGDMLSLGLVDDEICIETKKTVN